MKTLFLLNKWLIIILSVLFLTVYFGVLFMIPVGFLQILCFLYLLGKWDALNPKIKSYLKTYGLLAATALVGLAIDQFSSEWTFAILLLSGVLAYFFSYITYRCYKIDRQENYVKLESHV
ncbi:MAG: hypothetical protein WBG46_09010 [Nonlabens sp.]